MEYSVNPANKTIHAKFTGYVDSESLIHHILTLRADKYFQNGFNVIVDLREACVPKGYTQAAKIAEFVKATSVTRHSFKLAILVRGVEQSHSADLYILLLGNEHLRTCQSLEVAEEWVSISSQVNEPSMEDNLP